MIIHVVQPGETLSVIADHYGVSMDLLAQINAIVDPNHLASGEALVILYPEQTYIIQEGDTLKDIADSFGVDIWQLLRNNPFLSDREYIYPGEQLVISYSGQTNIQIITNGYTYPFINRNVLRKTLPYLTYLTIFSHQITSEGNLTSIKDEDIIQMAKEYEVAPIMLISPLTSTGTLDTTITQSIMNSESKQLVLIYEVLHVLNEKGYHGVNIDFQYIPILDRPRFLRFIEQFATTIRAEGFQVFITISPTLIDIETVQVGTNYNILSEFVDKLILLTYDWCTIRGCPQSLIPITSYRNYL